MWLDTRIHELAATQHALIAAWQLRALGADYEEVDRLRSGVDWHAVTPRVLARTGVAESSHRRLMAAVLDVSPGAVVSHSSAAWLWGAPGYRLEPAHVTRHRGVSRRPSELAVVHEVVDLLPQHVKLIDGIPVASPARVVCEMCAVVHPLKAERLLEHFWRERLLDGATFDRTVADLAGRGRRGSPVMRALSASRGPGYVPRASGLEMRFEEVLARYGERPLRRQVDAGDADGWVGRVDYRDPDLPLIVEIQSEKYHTSLVDTAADATRMARLEAVGFTVLPIWDTDVWHRPAQVAATIADARRYLRVGLAVPNPRRN